jgi:hypothetical protein
MIMTNFGSSQISMSWRDDRRDKDDGTVNSGIKALMQG